jgi:uncharacterized protein (DUF58 family)
MPLFLGTRARLRIGTSPLARFVRRMLAMYRVFRQVGRRSMQRFTPAGRFVLWAYVASLVFVVNTRRTMNYQIFSLLLTLLVVAFAASRFRRLSTEEFSVRRVTPRLATAGAPLRYTLVLHNNGDAPQRSVTFLESLEPEHALAGEWSLPRGKGQHPPVRLAWAALAAREAGGLLVKELPVPDLPAGGETRLQVEVDAPRRGVLHFRESALAVPDPLGLFRSMTPMHGGDKILVLPKRYALPPLEITGGRRRQPGGIRLASRVGESGEFTSLREYRRGDPLKRIHWRGWARHGKPIVMEFQEEYFTRHALVLDTFPEPGRMPDPEDVRCFEEAVSLASSFAAMERPQDALLDLLFVEAKAHCVTAGRGLGDAGQMLEILAGVRPCLDRPFSELARLVAAHGGLVSGCICVFLGYDAQRRALVRELLAQKVEVLGLVFAPANSPVPEVEPGAGLRMLVLHPGQVEEGLQSLGKSGGWS